MLLILISLYCSTYLKQKDFFIEELRNFTSYSQYYEDLILFKIFNDVAKGFYIDVGANDPDVISVTKAFYLKGWNGINIEPLPDKFNSLLQKRPKDINLQMGVGENEGNSTLYLGGLGSTVHKEFTSNTTKSINIKIDTMSNICKDYIKKDLKIQFCKIDVEGSEKKVLLGFDFENYRPQVFLIESTLPSTNIPSYSAWEYILFKNNYSFAYQYSINRFYVDNSLPILKSKFLNIGKYIEIFKSFKK